LASVGPGFVAASHTAWWLVAGCGAAVGALGFLSTGARANESARAVARQLGNVDGAEEREVELVGA
jgi:hypothetical protein